MAYFPRRYTSGGYDSMDYPSAQPDYQSAGYLMPRQPVAYPSMPPPLPPQQPIYSTQALQPVYPTSQALQPVYPTSQALQPVYPSSQPLQPVYTTQTVQPSSDVVAVTVKTAGTNGNGQYVVNKRYKYYGIILCMLAIASLGVEIGNIIFTYLWLCSTSLTSSQASSMPYILTWIAAGVWGSIPVFITGIIAIRIAGKFSETSKQVRRFAIICALCAFVFTPAIIGISIAEIIMFSGYCAGSGQNGYNFNNTNSLSSAKFILPVVEASLGGIEFYLTFMVTAIFCCCRKPGMNNWWNTSTPQTTDATATTPSSNYQTLPAAAPQQASGNSAPVQVTYLPPEISSPRSSYAPIYRPAISRGFGMSSGYNNYPGAMSPYSMYGANPTMSSFMTPRPNPAYGFYG